MRTSWLRARAGYARAGVWHRRGVVVLLLLTAILAAIAAAAAPAYRLAAADSSLQVTLGEAPPADSGVAVGGGGTADTHPMSQLARLVPRLAFARERVATAQTTAQVRQSPSQPTREVTIFGSTDMCGHLVLVSGRCPVTSGETAVPSDAVAATGWTTGASLTANSFAANPQGVCSDSVFGVWGGCPREKRLPDGSVYTPGAKPVRLLVVGVYRVPHPADPYWMGGAPDAPALPGTTAQLSLVTDPVAFNSFPASAEVSAQVLQPLRTPLIRERDVATLTRSVAHLRAFGGGHLAALTALPQLLHQDASNRHVLDTVTQVGDLQLLVLIGLVLVVVLSLAVTARRTEAAAGTLRGRRPPIVALSLSAESAAVVVAGSVIGLLVAPVIVAATGAHRLRPGTTVPAVTTTGLLTVVVVVAVALLTAFVVGLWAARRPPVEQLTGADPVGARSSTWWEVVAFTLAVAGVIELLTAGGVRDRATPWALLAPSLSGLAAALLIARLVPRSLGALVNRTRGSAHLSVFLLLRELRRDSVGWRVGAVVAMAVSLLSFGVAIDRGATADRLDRAGLVTGAPAVAEVAAPAGRSVLEVTHAVDPSGRWAMAAEQVTPFASTDERTLAIDAPRLAAVAGWSRPLGGASPADFTAALRPSAPAPLVVHTSRLPLQLDVSQLVAPAATRLALSVTDPSGGRHTVSTTALRTGRQNDIVALRGCEREPGCRVLGLTVGSPSGSSAFDLSMTLSGLPTTGPWTIHNGTATPAAGGWHIQVSLRPHEAGVFELTRREAPPSLPIVRAGHAASAVIGLDSEQLSARTVTVAPLLPRLLQAGSLVDLSYLQLADQGLASGTTLVQQQVWLGPRAPADAISLLRAHGLSVESVERASNLAATFDRLDPALGLDAFLAVALLAALLALALLIGNGTITARRRRQEFVALATAGVPTGALARGWFAAATARLAFAVGAGLAAGLGVAHLAAAGVPLAAAGSVPPPILNVPTWPAVIAAIATLLPLLLAEAAGVRWSVRRSGLRRAREVVA